MERVKVFIYLSEDVEDLASLVHGELPQTSGQTTSDGETTLVGSDGTCKGGRRGRETCVIAGACDTFGYID